MEGLLPVEDEPEAQGQETLARTTRKVLAHHLAPNFCWSIDFMRDTLHSGRTFRTSNAVDDYIRKALAAEVDPGEHVGRVVRMLDSIAEERGHYPEKLRLDNGPEFIGSTMSTWSEVHGLVLEFIQPGKPAQNSYVERHNKTEVLDLYVLNSLDEVREATKNFVREHNEEQPRSPSETCLQLPQLPPPQRFYNSWWP